MPDIEIGSDDVVVQPTGQGQQLQYVAIEQAVPGTTILVPAPGPGLRIKVVSYALVLGVTGTFQFAGSSVLTGLVPVAAFGGVAVVGQPSSPLFQTDVNQALLLTTTLSGAHGHLTYFVEP